MNGYELTRNWFNFSFENHEAKVQHTALFCWIVELNNRLGWKKEFGLPTIDTMEGLSIGNKNTFLAALSDLEKWGFIKIIKPSKNQYQACIISICCNESATAQGTALDTALQQQSNGIGYGTAHGSVPIDKQLNKETIKQLNNKEPDQLFEKFWNLYDKKKGKEKTILQWGKLKTEEKEKAINGISFYQKYQPESKYRKDPERYLSNRVWEDEEIYKAKQVIPQNNGQQTQKATLNNTGRYE
jgi:hypothetical protein